jgi:hypothetical protein
MLQSRKKSTYKWTKVFTFPFAVSESWRVQVLERLIEPSLRDFAMAIVAVECEDRLLQDRMEKKKIKQTQ